MAPEIPPGSSLVRDNGTGLLASPLAPCRVMCIDIAPAVVAVSICGSASAMAVPTVTIRARVVESISGVQLLKTEVTAVERLLWNS